MSDTAHNFMVTCWYIFLVFLGATIPVLGITFFIGGVIGGLNYK